MSTTGHENELISVSGLKASLQKLKTNKIDNKVSTIDYNTSSKKITKTINGYTTDVVAASKIVTDGGGITSHQDISGKADKATTLSGYGITDAYTKTETYNKTEVNGLVSTPHQKYVTVATYASLPTPGSADTIYRVSNYNGSTNQVVTTMYSEYTWNGSSYTFLCVKPQIDEVFDITAYNSNTKYADLSAALGTNGANIPQELRRGGMSVKFVQSSDDNYVQYRLMSQAFSTTESDWQGVDEEPTVESDNLVKSGGVFKTSVLVENKDRFVAGRINGSGAIEGAAGYVCAYQIPLNEFPQPLSLYNVSNNTAYSVYGVTFYDASKARLSSLDLPRGLNPIVILDGNNIPNDAVYFSVTCSEAKDYGIESVSVVDYIRNGYIYLGIATTSTTPADNPKAFYLATQVGAYTNFGVEIQKEGLYIISGGNGTWKAESLSDNTTNTYIQAQSISQIGMLSSKRIVNDGSLADGSGYAALYKYPVSLLKFPLLVCGVADNHVYNIYGVTYYNAEGVLSQLSQKGDLIINKEDVPSGATAISFSFTTSKQFGLSSLHTPDEYVPANKNLFVHKNKRINAEGNLESAEGYVSAYKVPLSRFNLPLYVYGVSQNTAYNVYGITCYDANGERIGFVNNQNYVVKDTIILTEDNLPNGTAYISVTSRKNLNGGIDGESVYNIVSNQRKDTTDYWEGKSICVIGDSITANGGWEPMLKDAMKLAHCYNRGISGSKLRDVAGPNNILLYTDRNEQDESIIKQYIPNDADIPSPIPADCVLLAKKETGMCDTKRLQYMVDNIPNVDAYIIWGGVNDWVMPSGIDTWGEVYNVIHNNSYDLTHLEDAYIKLVKHCRSINPLARIFCIGVPRAVGYIDNMQEVGGRPGADYLFAINDSLKRISNLLSVPFLNLLDITPISIENTQSYGDGLHPTTDLGFRTYAGEIASFLKQYMPLV